MAIDNMVIGSKKTVDLLVATRFVNTIAISVCIFVLY